MTDTENSSRHYALIFGLSANPVHQGHIDLLTGSLENLRYLGYDIAHILIVPVYRRNPVGISKSSLPKSYEQRVSMCEIAAQEVRSKFPDTIISVSRVEADLAKKSLTPNYTAETLTYLKTHDLNNFELIFIISSELVSGENPEFSQWYQTDTILTTARLAVCPRPGFPPNQNYINAQTKIGGCFIILDDVITPNISSTLIRQRLQKGEDPHVLAQEGWIPSSIAKYLVEHNLYLKCRIAHKNQFHH